jgi:hypothetical protein
MPKPTIRLDSGGIWAMLKSAEVRRAVHEAAERIADRVRSDPAVVRHEVADDVNVRDYTTDRAVSVVAIAHPAGRGLEAKHGSLSKAVSG